MKYLGDITKIIGIKSNLTNHCCDAHKKPVSIDFVCLGYESETGKKLR